MRRGNAAHAQRSNEQTRARAPRPSARDATMTTDVMIFGSDGGGQGEVPAFNASRHVVVVPCSGDVEDAGPARHVLHVPLAPDR
jgi:hypothetical protein